MTTIVQQRFVHMRRPHVCGLRTTITALNWSGPLTIRSTVEGDVGNEGVDRYRGLSGSHLEPEQSTVVDGALLHTTRTSQSRIRVAVAVKLALAYDVPAGVIVPATGDGALAEELTVPMSAGEPVSGRQAGHCRDIARRRDSRTRRHRARPAGAPARLRRRWWPST